MRNILLLLLLFLSVQPLWAQPQDGDKFNETSIYGQLAIKINPDEAWKAIKENYGHVGNHHKGIKYAYAMDEQVPLNDGAIRYSQLNRTEYLKEAITTYDEANKFFTTTVYETTESNLPILQQTVGIKLVHGQTYVYHEIIYKNGTRLEVGKIKKWNRAYVKAYKEVVEEMMHEESKMKQFQKRLASMLYEEN